MSVNKNIHRTIILKKDDFFIEQGKRCVYIGKLTKGVLRGFEYDIDGNEITTHFYQENDMVVGSFIPNANMAFTIQALEDSELSVANYQEVMANVNKDVEITKVITDEFQKLNHKLQSRLVSLLNRNSLEKYELFLSEYPSLINRIPNYYIANFLGITPTQLSRARKQFTGKDK
ncbi:Crp/Fnr family transcriptional regulator [Aquimarina gracilis]|uniref:Crp/Fnr family transcriptional regulator n=1 Tax=Aquimarina gracilis TaxID=874422 RepID=A0ABU5ZX48_9FLAO|nr:Crp/Fnr family transcriptional regulator [Aquimarina gracilis]MEB3346417.1 Crp/Fnr family transcriptional regulator [Aquimarina gracilis]